MQGSFVNVIFPQRSAGPGFNLTNLTCSVGRSRSAKPRHVCEMTNATMRVARRAVVAAVGIAVSLCSPTTPLVPPPIAK